MLFNNSVCCHIYICHCDIRLTANECNNSNSKPFIVILYYVTCCRDLRVATPLAGDVGDARPNVIY